MWASESDLKAKTHTEFSSIDHPAPPSKGKWTAPKVK